MIPIRFLLPLLSLSLPLGAQRIASPEVPVGLPAGAPVAIAHVDSVELLQHASWLAADERGGRLTGTPGQEAAARYIAEHFAALGLQPWGDPIAVEDRAEGDPERSFFQSYPLVRTALEETSGLTVGDRQWRTGFAVLGAGPGEVAIEGRLRFVGLGRTRGRNAEVGDDEDLSGVVPLAVVRLPRGRIDRRLTVEQQFLMSFRALSTVGRTAANLGKRGAKAVVFLLPDDTTGLMDVLTYAALLPGKPLLAPRWKKAGGDMSAMMGMLTGGSGVPAVVLGPGTSAEVMAAAGLQPEALAAFLQARTRETLPEIAATAAALRLAVRRDDQAVARNVVALLRGRDPDLRDEVVVYSAHMDHVGRRLDGEIFNGADDNASGSAGLLEIAQAFALAEERPRRSVLFLSVSGEELGLWGSEYFAEHPTWPLEKIVADINTDMIGRSGPESGPQEVTVTPSYRHPAFSSIVRDAAGLAEELGLRFVSGDKYYQRSDHYNFAVKGIPVVFFCNGEHEDYHQVTDEPEKLDGTKMQRIARLAFWTGWQVANGDRRPEVLGPADGWR